MENASKALIIAGAILLSILLISLGIFIFSQAQDTLDSVNMDEQEIQAFNNKFTPYEGDRVRGSQVNALAQAVLSNNQSAKNNGETDTKGIKMSGKGVGISPDGSSTSFTRLPAGTFYSVKFTYKNSLVNEIEVKDAGTSSGTSTSTP